MQVGDVVQKWSNRKLQVGSVAELLAFKRCLVNWADGSIERVRRSELSPVEDAPLCVECGQDANSCVSGRNLCPNCWESSYQECYE